MNKLVQNPAFWTTNFAKLYEKSPPRQAAGENQISRDIKNSD